MRFSHSSISTFLTCEELYNHRYVKGITTRKKPIYYVTGSSMHKFGEIFYATRNIKDALKAAMKVFDDVDTSTLSSEEIHKLECEKAMVQGICEAYPEFYKNDFDQFESFLTEQRFKFKLTDKHTYSGDIDILGKDGAGDWWIIETKTAAASTLTADYFDRVRIDSQVHGYMHGAKSILGVFPRGVVYNVIKKPAIRLKKGETKQAFQKRVYYEYKKFGEAKNYFQRYEIIVDRQVLQEWLEDTVEVAKRIAKKFRKKDEVIWPKNTNACTAKFGACEFLRACVDRKYSKIIYKKFDR